MSRMSARFPGTCAECRTAIKVGDEIEYADRRALCAECAPAPIAAPPAIVHVAAAGKEVAFRLAGRLPGDGFATYRAALTGSRYKEGTNYLPLARCGGALAALNAAAIPVDVAPAVRDAIATMEAEQVSALTGAAVRTEAVDAVLAARGGALYAYQREGVAWLAPRRSACSARTSRKVRLSTPTSARWP